jgi:hypothetical protein
VRGRSRRPNPGLTRYRPKAWHERSEGIIRLAHDRALVAREYPTLNYHIDDDSGVVTLEGKLVYRAACGIPTEVPVRIDFPFDYPHHEPLAYDSGGLFEHSADRHFATDDGQCCLWLPPKSCWNPTDPDTLLTFLHEVVVFFDRQLVYDATGRKNWPGGNYGHGIGGWREWIAEVIGDDRVLQVFIPILKSNEKVGRNESCRCGSGRKFKRCHADVIENIRRKVPFSKLRQIFDGNISPQ